MPSLPKSLTGRLLVTAVAALLLAMIFTLFVIGNFLEDFVKGEIDKRLDAQISVLARAMNPDGSLKDPDAIDFLPLDQSGSGWGWEVIGPNGTLHSASLGHTNLPIPRNWAWSSALPSEPVPITHPLKTVRRPRPLPFDTKDAQGRLLHYRVLRLRTTSGLVTIVAVAPAADLLPRVRDALGPLLACLFVLATLLVIALAIQLRIGLLPLTRLQLLIAQVREGRLHHIEVDEPIEMLPLVDALNSLIEANDKALARARSHVANLAHGLKTPLATLRLDIRELAMDSDGRLLTQVLRMESQIRHHLGRATVSDLEFMANTPISLRTCLGDLVDVLARIYADRDILAQLDIAAELAVRCDPQDLDELFGNLLDNAWRWARSTVRVEARPDGRYVLVTINDDGPGMREAELRKVTEGHRLDEVEAGQGFGLSISRDLSELHGGGLALGRGELGGLEVTVRLQRG